MRDDAIGAERLAESNRRRDEVVPGLDVVMGQIISSGAGAGSSAVHARRET